MVLEIVMEKPHDFSWGWGLAQERGSLSRLGVDRQNEGESAFHNIHVNLSALFKSRVPEPITP